MSLSCSVYCVLATEIILLFCSFSTFSAFFQFGFIQFQKIIAHCATSFIQMGAIIHIYAKTPELHLIHTLYIIVASSIQRCCCWKYNNEPEYRIHQEIHLWNIPMNTYYSQRSVKWILLSSLKFVGNLNYCSDFCNFCLNDFSFLTQSTRLIQSESFSFIIKLIHIRHW